MQGLLKALLLTLTLTLQGLLKALLLTLTLTLQGLLKALLKLAAALNPLQSA